MSGHHGLPEQARANRRLAWLLAGVAAAFGLLFVARIAWLGH